MLIIICSPLVFYYNINLQEIPSGFSKIPKFFDCLDEIAKEKTAVKGNSGFLAMKTSGK
jgi:hypothetical protein